MTPVVRWVYRQPCFEYDEKSSATLHALSTFEEYVCGLQNYYRSAELPVGVLALENSKTVLVVPLSANLLQGISAFTEAPTFRSQLSRLFKPHHVGTVIAIPRASRRRRPAGRRVFK